MGILPEAHIEGDVDLADEITGVVAPAFDKELCGGLSVFLADEFPHYLIAFANIFAYGNIFTKCFHASLLLEVV